MISLQRSMHSSQMYTPGPAMSFLTCFWLFPQNEHFSRSPPSPIRATGDDSFDQAGGIRFLEPVSNPSPTDSVSTLPSNSKVPRRTPIWDGDTTLLTPSGPAPGHHRVITDPPRLTPKAPAPTPCAIP